MVNPAKRRFTPRVNANQTDRYAAMLEVSKSVTDWYLTAATRPLTVDNSQCGYPRHILSGLTELP
jgi:hypothetical protein